MKVNNSFSHNQSNLSPITNNQKNNKIVKEECKQKNLDNTKNNTCFSKKSNFTSCISDFMANFFPSIKNDSDIMELNIKKLPRSIFIEEKHTDKAKENLGENISRHSSQAWFKEINSKTANVEFLDSTQLEHRFSDVRCPKHTAIQMLTDRGPEYFHANMVETPDKRRYVLSQYPLPAASPLFWEYACKHGGFIIDLTQVGEVKEDHYPETLNVSFAKDGLEIILKDVSGNDSLSGLVIYSYLVKNKGTGNLRVITRLNYQKWVDHASGAAIDLFNLVKIVEKHLALSKETIPIIHCRAGVGRSGTFLTAMTLFHLIQEKSVNYSNLKQKIEEIILLCREQRGPMFVQNHNQLNTLLEFGKAALNT